MNPILAPFLLPVLGYLAGVYLLVGALIYLVLLSLDRGKFTFAVLGIRSDCAKHGHSPLWALPIALALVVACTVEWALVWPWRLWGE